MTSSQRTEPIGTRVFTTIAIALVIALAIIEAWVVPYLPIHAIVTANADGLLIEDVARDLLAGASIFDWRLTQAPYLFPDIALAFLLAWLGIGTGLIGLVYIPVLAAASLLLLWWVCRGARLPTLVPVLVAACMFLLGNLLPPFTDGISIGFALIGHHSGIIVLSLLFLGFTIRFLIERGSYRVSLIGAAAVLAIGVMSDASLAWTVLPATALASFATIMNRSVESRRWIEFWIACALGLVMSRIFSLLTPYRQDADFLGNALSGWPQTLPGSLGHFVADVSTGISTQPTFMIVFFTTLSAMAVGGWTLTSAYRPGHRVSPETILIAAVCVTAPVLGFGIPLVLGSYVPGLGLQRFAPMAFLSVAFGAALLEVRVRGIGMTVGVTVVAFCALATFLVRAPELIGSQGRGNAFEAVAVCLRAEGVPVGTAFVADYWAARAIRLYSQGNYVPVPVNDGFQQFSTGSNVRRTRQARPTLGVAYYRHPTDTFVDRFGQPTRILCEDEASGIAVLDYSGRASALAGLAEIAQQAS